MFLNSDDATYFTNDKIQNAIDLNLAMGSKYMVMASSRPKPGVDGWKEVADTLNLRRENWKLRG